MEEALVSSFTAAAEEVLREIGLDVVRVGSAAGSEIETDTTAAIIATVGILGDARGSLLLRLDRETARNVVAAMYRSLGLEDRQPRDINETAIAEIANQICGRAMTILSRRSVECDITPPAVITGTQITSSLPGIVDLEYRSIEGPFGKLFVFLGLKS